VNASHADSGATPLLIACAAGNVPGAVLLLRHGADPSAVDAQGRTALHWCALAGSAALARKILRRTRGGVLNAQDSSGYSALMTAAEHGREEVVRLLLAWRADAVLRNKLNHTAIELADWFGHRSLCAALEAAMAAAGQLSAEAQAILAAQAAGVGVAGGAVGGLAGALGGAAGAHAAGTTGAISPIQRAAHGSPDVAMAGGRASVDVGPFTTTSSSSSTSTGAVVGGAGIGGGSSYFGAGSARSGAAAPGAAGGAGDLDGRGSSGGPIRMGSGGGGVAGVPAAPGVGPASGAAVGAVRGATGAVGAHHHAVGPVGASGLGGAGALGSHQPHPGGAHGAHLHSSGSHGGQQQQQQQQQGAAAAAAAAHHHSQHHSHHHHLHVHTAAQAMGAHLTTSLAISTIAPAGAQG
jgi:hypothetical protein